MAKCTFYVQIEPTFMRHNRDRLHSIQAVRITQKRPASPVPGVLIAKLTIEVPDAAFEPLQTEAVVQIPLEHTEPVQVASSPVEVLPSE